MNYIHHLNAFLSQLQKETRLNANHISLYYALFHNWNMHRFRDQFPIIRERLMQVSKIRSKATYLKCLRELHLYDYIIYYPSLHKHHRSKVSMVKWAVEKAPVATGEQHTRLTLEMGSGRGWLPVPLLTPEPLKSNPLLVPGLSGVLLKIDTLPVPFLGPDNKLNNKQNINNVNIERETPAQNFHFQSNTIPPVWEHVQAYFNKTGATENQAALFFNHYKANGWKQAGKTPITDWHAAANKWMIYEKNKTIIPPTGKTPNNPNVDQNKNYEDPL